MPYLHSRYHYRFNFLPAPSKCLTYNSKFKTNKQNVCPTRECFHDWMNKLVQLFHMEHSFCFLLGMNPSPLSHFASPDARTECSTGVGILAVFTFLHPWEVFLSGLEKCVFVQRLFCVYVPVGNGKQQSFHFQSSTQSGMRTE